MAVDDRGDLPALPPHSDLPALPPHLDPRIDPAVGRTRSRSATRIERRSRERRNRKALVIGSRVIAAILSLVILVGAGVATNLLTRINDKSATAQAPEDVAGNVDATDVENDEGSTYSGEDQNILIVGNDSRAGYTDPALIEELGAYGDDGSMNTDTIMLVHVPADGSRASVVSFPRDSYVSIPNCGMNKINSAYGCGYNYEAPADATTAERVKAGQSKLIVTISQLSGLKVDHYVEVTLLGFYKLTQMLGGIEVDLCVAASDPQYTGIDLTAGKHLLKGKDAIRFVRQRHNLPNGDLDRIKRQQYFFGAVIRKILDQQILDLFNVGKLQDLVDALAGTITYDPGLNPLQLADQMRNVAAGNVEFRTVPLNPAVYGEVEGAGSVVLLAEPAQLRTFFRMLNKKVEAPAASSSSSAASSSAPPATVAPAQVSLDVFNATGVQGMGTQTANQLGELGYGINSINTADQAQVDTTITYPPALAAQANTIALLVPDAVLTPDPQATGSTVQLILGSTFTALQTADTPEDPSDPAAPSTTIAPPDRTAGSATCVN